MVVVDQIPWNEMDGDPALALDAEDPFCRGLETQLRSTLYSWSTCAETWSSSAKS